MLLQGAVTANELGQYCLEVLLALTQEEGDQMLSELAGRDRAESQEVFGMVARILVRNMMIMRRCRILVAVEETNIRVSCFH